MNFLVILLIFIFGLIVGSFLNVVILRLKDGEQFLKGRSHCPKCKKELSWYENIPLVSFFVLGGKCRYCKKPISWQYPLVELATGILFVMTFIITMKQWSNEAISSVSLFHCFIVSLLRYWFFIAVLILIFVYDLKYKIIPDAISLPAILIALVLNLLTGFNFLNLLISGIIGAGFFLLQYLISQGKWIGGGDIRLGGLMGVMLGLNNLLVALFLAYVFGALVSIFLIVFAKKSWKSEIAFGTFLSLATFIALFWGEEIIEWYFSLF